VNITVVCFGALRDYLPPGATGNRAEVELPDGADVEALVLTLQIPYRRVYALLVNGEQGEGSTRLSEGDEVTLMPPFSGGASRPRSL
jgi:molybdopterin converting factor small subunit